jgi:hypothetical protein
MSERSKNLARYIRKAKGRQQEMNQGNHDELLDKGFALLKENLAREFHNQIAEVNHEPGCMDSLGSTFRDKDSRVFKFGEEDKGLVVDFNAENRTAEIKGKDPIEFYYFIKVRLSKDETKWCYAGAEDKEQLVPITGKLDTVVEKALYAIYGVEA